ncbi:Vitamin B12 import ATP-binding protein BtuD [Pseudoalteromonas holothuriae]|uniref:Vitamin B12 import ATP-binding protein BtuD n=1 Tax=Pseudoalteromonas holothuriae TaxID=2963714 RepID=A0ABM9GNX9_9GAMM|nr:ABC transporter ATP-binding protein [Pseudoalteromonas sp. CIP111951]CAH9068287.1 Vitamin B12 import ATP-binding protein BtuD [Pseudoalteromonas sp. CIP111951]
MSTIVEVNQLSKSFGSKQALSNVSFTIESGSTTALVGPNGAGKTTLFSVLCGYLRPNSGSVKILDKPLGHPSLFGKLTALPQDAMLDPRFSIQKQLCFYGVLQGLNKIEALKDTTRVLELVGLSDNHNSQINELSHGMRKRVCIAQALLGKPQIVLLDEATAGLDPLNAREIRSLISSLSDEVSFILSSHDLAELERLCSHVLYLDKGVLSAHNRNEQIGSSKYITLQLHEQYKDAKELLKQLSGVLHISQSQNKEFIIEYQSCFEQFDIHLLKYCYKHNWQYRQVVNGHTLENQLFQKD